MLDFEKATQIMAEHCVGLTTDEFLANLEKYCPELFAETSGSVDLDRLKNNDIYRQAQTDGKLKIAPKLLNKGLSFQEVAELLELDLDVVKETVAS